MSANHQFDPTILREYDIRGIVGDTLTEDDARAIGRTFGTIVRRAGGTRVCIGYDGRLSSPMMEAAVVEGLCAAGVDVDRVGMGPTPMLYFAVRSTEADGGVMITGSHNPPDYNGFKMMIGKKSFFGQDIQKLGRMAAAGDWESGSGSARATPMLDAYVDRIAADYDGTKDLTVVWDAGNGSAGEAMKMLTAKLPGTHHLLFADIDGQFPNHHPDPTVEKNLADLKAKVAETKADLGIAFDGDGDRIGVVDNQGRILWGDQLMVLWSRDVLAKHPGATVIADVKASQVLFDEIAKAGGQPQMGRTGHSLIKAAMAETGAPLAGEMSGHIFFADHYYGFDDALYAAVRLLGVISRGDQTIGEIRDGLPHMVNTPEIRFQCPEDRKFKVATEVKERLAGTDVDVNDIDGVRVTTADGWWLLRASNTQDVLVARCEAHDEAGLEKLKGLLREQLVASGITPPEM